MGTQEKSEFLEKNGIHSLFFAPEDRAFTSLPLTFTVITSEQL